MAQRRRTRTFEPVEPRRLLAVDLNLTDFSADNTNWTLTYTIAGGPAPDVQIAIYRSADGVTPDAPLQTTAVLTDNGQSSRSVTVVPNFSDTASDYFLLAKLLPGDATPANDSRVFAGGMFRALDPVTGQNVLHLHGGAAGDSVTIAQPSTLDVTATFVSGGAAQHLTASTIAEIHVRTHVGADTVGLASSVTKPAWLFGGADVDNLTGGTGADMLAGGGDNDILAGAGGNDTYLFAGALALGTDNITDTSGTDTLDF